MRKGKGFRASKAMEQVSPVIHAVLHAVDLARQSNLLPPTSAIPSDLNHTAILQTLANKHPQQSNISDDPLGARSPAPAPAPARAPARARSPARGLPLLTFKIPITVRQQSMIVDLGWQLRNRWFRWVARCECGKYEPRLYWRSDSCKLLCCKCFGLVKQSRVAIPRILQPVKILTDAERKQAELRKHGRIVNHQAKALFRLGSDVHLG